MSRVGIYGWKNKITNKWYIGKTSNQDKRLKVYKQKNGFNRHTRLYNSIKKNGIQNFQYNWLKDCPTKDGLNGLEKLYIKMYDSFNNGYNSTIGGQGCNGYKHSEQIRKKISLGVSGKNHPCYGKKHTQQVKLKISLSNKGKKRSEQIINKMKIIQGNRVKKDFPTVVVDKDGIPQIIYPKDFTYYRDCDWKRACVNLYARNLRNKNKGVSV